MRQRQRVVPRVGRNIDAFFPARSGCAICRPWTSSLAGEDAEGWSCYGVITEPLLPEFRRGPLPVRHKCAKHGVVVTLRLLEVFFPPAAPGVDMSCVEMVQTEQYGYQSVYQFL